MHKDDKGNDVPDKVSDFETYNYNPSIDRITSLVKVANKEAVKAPATIHRHDGGETYDGMVDTGEFVFTDGYTYRDNGRFAKMFTGTETIIRELNNPAMRVLMLIIRNMVSNSDKVRIDAEVFAKELGYKGTKSVYDGLFGLLKASLIYRKAGLDGEYFVDVNKLFKGHRAKLKD